VREGTRQAKGLSLICLVKCCRSSEGPADAADRMQRGQVHHAHERRRHRLSAAHLSQADWITQMQESFRTPVASAVIPALSAPRARLGCCHA